MIHTDGRPTVAMRESDKVEPKPPPKKPVHVGECRGCDSSKCCRDR